LIRYSVGIEDAEDLIADLAAALETCEATSGAIIHKFSDPIFRIIAH